MRRKRVCGFSVAWAAAFLLAATVALSGTRQPITVVRVIDGDTVDVRTGSHRQRVRLLGVDAPEVAHRNRPGEPFGRVSTRFAREMLGKARLVELEVAGDRRDAYGRTLGFLWLNIPGRAGPVNLSEELLRQGLGRAVRGFRYPGKERFLELEREARHSGRGLWGR